MSRGLAAVEQFLGNAGFDRAPWLAVAYGGGISAWFMLPSQSHWLALVVSCCAFSCGVAALQGQGGAYSYLRLTGIVVPLVIAAGCGAVWGRSHIVGAEPIATPTVATLDGKIISLEPQPAQERHRIILATREPQSGRPIKVRLNLSNEKSPLKGAIAGSIVRVRARLVPPGAPPVPGGYNFARTAWFMGLAATGSALGPLEIIEQGSGGAWLSEMQYRLTAHVYDQVDQAEGGVAAALTTGDVGGISESDSKAMRDSGLTHLVSISGLHVSAVIGAAYLLTLRLLALVPWLALRVRLPIVAAGSGALVGIAYTLLSGAQVPTVRSCIGALLVLAALVLGREALTVRMLAMAAFLVLVLWPEAVMGPSFQMSFAAVLAIVALSGAAPIKRFLAPREESMMIRGARQLCMLLLTGLLIEFALMPIVLFHFHRAGFYGAFANIVAIPLTTVVIMPSVLVGFLLDTLGLGAPAWWVTSKAVALLMLVAHWVSSRPGSVTLLPAFGGGTYILFVIGGLWLALWSGRIRWLGFLPVMVGVGLVVTNRPADILISGDGRHVGLMSENGEELFVLRKSKGGFAIDNVIEMTGMEGEPATIASWPGAQCNPDACVINLWDGVRDWSILATRSKALLPERALAATCERVDIVLSDRWLPRSCKPRWLKVDRRMLGQTGGLAIDLRHGRVTSVAQGEGQHGWWRPAPQDAWPRSKD